MGPDVDTFVVHHEETLEQFRDGVEVDPIPRVYLVIILQVRRRSMKITDEGLDLS